MARWISLSVFKELYTKETDLLSPEAHASFLNRLQSSEGDAIREKEGIDRNDFLQFVASIQSPESIVFHGWVNQSTSLSKTLAEEKVAGKFRDDQNVLSHTFAPKFKQFLSPFLGPILLRGIPSEMEALTNHYSFCPLLEDDTRATVEMQLFKPVRAQLEELSTAHTLNNEQALINTVTPLCSDAFMESMNYLSKRSYALKMEYVDRIMEAIHAPSCTVRFANWILKQMERLELNKEHKVKLYNLRKDLAAGKLQVKKLEMAKTGIRIRPILVGLIILGVLGTGIYLLIAKPFSEADVYHAYDSANADFTEEELKKIDSLASVIDDESFMEGRMVDPNIVIQSGTQIALREPFKTPLMEQIFSDVNKDVTLKENYYEDSCAKDVDFVRYPGVKDLSKKSGKKSVEFRNSSDYDIIVYVSDNKTSGSVYSLIVRYGMTATFKMNAGDVLTTVAGQEFVPFVPPVGSFQEEKPSQKFRYHFCSTDENYFESINTSLKLGSTYRTDVRFMVTGSSVAPYQLIDVHSVAEAY
ncbi:MAG: hypothetical protein NXI10_02935 [bacterium]|nr:hypothetical protein [bacterium]